MKEIKLLYALAVTLLFWGCGGVVSGGGSSGSGSATFNLTIQNPDPNASGKALAYKAAVIPEPQPSLSSTKAAVASASVTCCSITGTGPGSISENICFTAGAATASGSIEITFGSNWTLCAECTDSTLTTNGIKGGYSGCTTTDIAQNTTVSLSPKFLNLIADDADDCQSIRINQDSATQSKLTILFGSKLTDPQKATAKVLVEFDTAGSRTVPGVLDATRNDGLTTGTKSGPYILFQGGVGRPSANLHNASDSKVMKLNCTWDTTVTTKTQANCTFGITQMKILLDSDEDGQWAALCSISGGAANIWDMMPNNSVLAKYLLTGNSSVENDRSSLIATGETCDADRNGETCNSGDCPANNICRSLTHTPIEASTAAVTNVAGPNAGDTTAGNTDGTGNAASFDTLIGVCLSLDGTQLFVVDRANNAIRQVDIATTAVTTLATGGDINSPQDCAADVNNVYVTNSNTEQVLKVIVATGAVSVLAGTGDAGNVNSTVGLQAQFNSPFGIVIGPALTHLYVADRDNNAIRKISLSGDNAVTTMADSTATGTNQINFLAVDATDTIIYFTDNGNNRVRKFVIGNTSSTTIAGSGVAGCTDGTGTAATFNTPGGLVLSSVDDYLYVAGVGCPNIRSINIATGVVTRIAGDSAVASDTNGTGTAARFGGPTGIAINVQGTILYVAEQNNNKIRQIVLTP